MSDAEMEAGRALDGSVAKLMGLPLCDNWIGYEQDGENSVYCWKHRPGDCVPSRVHGWFGEYTVKDACEEFCGKYKGREEQYLKRYELWIPGNDLPQILKDMDYSECSEYAKPSPYSTCISAAWEVVEKMRENKLSVTVTGYWEGSTEKWWVSVMDNVECSGQANADTAPHAICLAALKAMEQPE